MKTLNTILPFHDSNRHLFQKDVEGYQQIDGVLTPTFEIIAFQIKTRTTSVVAVDRFELFEADKNGKKLGPSVDLSSLIPDLIVQVYEGFARIINEGLILTELVTYSDYIMEVDYGGFTYTSELLTTFEANLAQFECSGHYALDYIIGFSSDVEAGVTVLRTDIDGTAFGFNFLTFRYDFGTEEVKDINVITAAIGDPAENIQSLIPLPAGVGVGDYEVEISGACGSQILPFSVIEAVIFSASRPSGNITVNILWQPFIGATTTIKDSFGNEYVATVTAVFTMPSNVGQFFHYNNIHFITTLRCENSSLVNIEKLGLYSNLVNLQLGNNYFTSIPSSITDCALTYLDMGQNSLTGFSEISGMTTLLTLFMDRNSINNVSGLETLVNLTYLDLSFNALSSLPSNISALVNLVDLVLNNNTLAALPSTLNALVSLINLTIDFNSGISLPSSIGTMNIEVIRANSCGNISLPNEIGNMSALRILDLDNCTITALPDGISNSNSLQELYLFNVEIAALPTNFGNISSLLVLDMYENDTISSNNGFPASFSNLNLTTFSITLAEGGQVPNLSSMPMTFLKLQANFSTAVPSTLFSPSLQTLEVFESENMDFNVLITAVDGAGITNLTKFRGGYNGAALFPTNINLLTTLTSIECPFWGFAVPASVSSLPNLTKFYYRADGALSSNLYSSNSIIDIRADYVTSIPAGINALTTLEYLYSRYFVTGAVLNSITTDIAKCYNLRVLDVSGQVVPQSNIESLLTAFDVDKANFVNPVTVNFRSQTPAIVYSPAMLAIISDLETNYGFTFLI